ncbi:MAG: helix-turn-helix domain-containing protein [Actinomycetota bacterium]
MSVQALAWVLEHSEAKGNARLVLLAIANHAHADGSSSFPSIRQIARESRCSPATVQASLKRLVAAGELAIEPGMGWGRKPGRRTNRYAILGMRDVSGIGTPLPGMDVPSGPSIVPIRAVDCTNGVARNRPTEPSLEPKDAHAAEAARARNGSWGELEDVRALLVELDAPDDLHDVDFWRRIDELTRGTQVFYDVELRKYLTWLESRPPSRRHKNRRRGFLTWISTEIGRDGRRAKGVRRAAAR